LDGCRSKAPEWGRQAVAWWHKPQVRAHALDTGVAGSDPGTLDVNLRVNHPIGAMIQLGWGRVGAFLRPGRG
jgi:hypothetical protein